MRRIWSLGMVGIALALGGCQAFFDDQKGLLGALPSYSVEARGERLSLSPPCGPAGVQPAPLQPGERAPGQPVPPAAGQPGAAGEAFAQAPPAGTEAPSSFNPNMFGDQFGSGHSSIKIPLILSQKDPFTYTYTSQYPYTPFYVWNKSTFAGLQMINTSGSGILTTIADASTVDNAFKAKPYAPIQVISNPKFDAVVQAQYPGAVFLSGTAVLQNANPPIPPSRGINAEYYEDPPVDTFLFVTQYGPLIAVPVPSPSAGGAVGRTKIADDNNPMPRDRFIFNFDYFNNVPLTATGVDVRRYSLGFEKTFFDRLTSIEVRLPFASTLNSDIVADGITNTHTEIGDVHVTLKALLWRSKTFNIASGLGIGLPTADDTRVRLADGTDLVRINNQAVILTPFAAVLFTPNDRFFAQAWYEVSFDANGNPVLTNPDFTGLTGAGKLNDQTLMQFDAQVGYWLIQPDSRGRGSAVWRLSSNFITTRRSPMRT